MDFLKLLRSLEEFLYELCTWFLFFPRTLYRVVVHPRRMAQYVDTELKEKLDRLRAAREQARSEKGSD